MHRLAKHDLACVLLTKITVKPMASALGPPRPLASPRKRQGDTYSTMMDTNNPELAKRYKSAQNGPVKLASQRLNISKKASL